MREWESTIRTILELILPLFVSGVMQCILFLGCLKRKKGIASLIVYYFSQMALYRIFFRVILLQKYGTEIWFQVVNYWLTIFWFIILVILIKRIFEDNLIKCLLAFFVSDIIGNIPGGISVGIRQLILNHIDNSTRDSMILLANLIAVVLGLLLDFAFFMLLRRWIRRYQDLEIKKDNKPVWFFVLFVMLFSPLTNLFGYSGGMMFVIAFSIILPLSFFILFLCTMGWFYNQNRHREEEQKRMYEKIQQDLMKEHYHSLQRQIEMTKEFREEILRQAENLDQIVSGNFLTEYGDSLRKQYDALQPNCFCENAIIDAMIQNKVRDSEKLGIETTVHIKQFSCGTIQEIDMLSILCNIMDNAIEGCQRMPGNARKYWCLESNIENQELKISMKNSMEKESISSGMKTSKKDKAAHGLGIKIVRDVVEKYEGKFEIDIKEKEFCVQITFYLAV